MGSSIVRNIIGTIVLIVLSFIIGIMAADNARSAAVIIIAAAAGVGIIAMGKHVWMTLFILPPLCHLLPQIGKMRLDYILYAVVLCYCLLLSILGYIKLTWRKLIGADIFVIAIFITLAISLYRYPIAIGYLDIIFDFQSKYTGGGAYSAYVCFLVLYICFSCIPFERKFLLKALKCNMILLLTCLFIRGLLTSENVDFHLESTVPVRYHMFAEFGRSLIIAVFCSAPAIKLITSPTSIIAIICSALTAIISGFRNMLASYVLLSITAIIIKKEYYILLICAALGITSLGVLHASDTLKELPFPIQRSLSIIPGLAVDKNIRKATDGSTDWRVTMWKWALNPNSGYIKDYAFGDGFRIEKSYADRYMRGVFQGTLINGDQVAYANMRIWHSLYIETLQSLGVLGVILILCCYLYACIVMYRVNTALLDTPYFKYSMLYTCKIVVITSVFFLSPNSLTNVFLYHLPILAYLKVFYNVAVREGKINTSYRKTRYIPILIKHEIHETDKFCNSKSMAINK